MTVAITATSISNRYQGHLGDDELIDDARNWRKLRRHLAWLNVHEPRILGAEGHELLLFVDIQAAACDEAIEARIDEDEILN